MLEKPTCGTLRARAVLVKVGKSSATEAETIRTDQRSA
jgi:hypothetical protein